MHENAKGLTMLLFKYIDLLLPFGLCMNKPISKTFKSYLYKKKAKIS